MKKFSKIISPLSHQDMEARQEFCFAFRGKQSHVLAGYARTVLLIFVLVVFISGRVFASQNESFNSSEGLKRLERSQFKNDFYQLVNFYQPQINPLYCAVATGVILLNASNDGKKIPSQKENQIQYPDVLGAGFAQFNSYSQLGFLNEKTDQIKKRSIIEFKETKLEKNGNEFYDAGISLDDFSKILRQVYGFKVTKKHTKTNDEDLQIGFRQDLKKYLSDKTSFVVVNFDGTIVENGTHGHISPIAAYDEVSDSILILDVALHKTNWYWVDLKKLLSAMNTKDGDNYRGYLIVAR